MALNAPRDWLISYDIRDPRRLARLHRFLKGVAVPVQYSVFTLRDTPARIGRLAGEIEEYVHQKQDDVRIYPVPDNPRIYVIGRQILDVGGTTYAGDELLATLAGNGRRT